ncbi:MAG: L,D-transpeptidase family protein [Clostridia bacterium]|nr:L,D-transpeptidase family protein [Clostridia bacterium]
MVKRALSLLFVLLLFLPFGALAQELGFTVVPASMRPGKVERISFSSPVGGQGRLELLSFSGELRCVLRESFAVAEGVNHLTWDGLDEAGDPVAAGEYTLCVTVDGTSAEQALSVGEPSPQILKLSAPDTMIGGEWVFTVTVNQLGMLNVRMKAEGAAEWNFVLSEMVPGGESELVWNGLMNGVSAAAGRYAVQFSLTDDSGFSGTAQQISLTIDGDAAEAQRETESEAEPEIPEETRVMIPSAVTTRDQEFNYWTLPIGDFNEEAIWEVMMQPLTVIVENGKSQKDVYRLRATPDATVSKENVVGEITYESQGVHILETLDNGWTLVEVYNSSYGPDCASRRGYGVTDDLIRGYVKTSLLKTITPRTDYGLLIDKLAQKMYIFSEGKCIGELLVSTGLNNSKQSWNETPSGEFVMISRMGGFAAGNLWCAYGMRVNGGCAIHEVPYIGNADTPAANRDYSSTVKQLGQKASHGCIRVQKAANEQGQNIKWLWDNIKVNTKVLIWDDTGRKRPYPVADDYELYYNPEGGKYFHEDQNCPSVKSRFLPMSPFTYGELDSDGFAKLTPCPKCTASTLLRKSKIDAMNALEN